MYKHDLELDNHQELIYHLTKLANHHRRTPLSLSLSLYLSIYLSIYLLNEEEMGY